MVLCSIKKGRLDLCHRLFPVAHSRSSDVGGLEDHCAFGTLGDGRYLNKSTGQLT